MVKFSQANKIYQQYRDSKVFWYLKWKEFNNFDENDLCDIFIFIFITKQTEYGVYSIYPGSYTFSFHVKQLFLKSIFESWYNDGSFSLIMHKFYI